MLSATLTANQHQFAEFLASLWQPRSGVFLHGYAIKRSRHWANWRKQVLTNTKYWWCESLSDAAERYSWADATPGTTFDALSRRLSWQLKEKDEQAVHETCLDLFRWGGVGRSPKDKSRRWLAERAATNSLCSALDSAVRRLRPGASDDLCDFDGICLLMNSAMTKVYSAIAPHHVMIYDGRVGAALGLMVLKWLDETGRPAVPSDLAFRWGAKQGDHRARNPSRGSLTLPNLYRPSSRPIHQDRAWAANARKASQISGTAAALAGGGSTLRQIESALFMIGYDVRSTEALPTPLPPVHSVRTGATPRWLANRG